MPFYEYECSNCKFYVEVLQKISDEPLRDCPSCKKSALKKLVSAPVFRLKGAGWYETDFKSENEGKRNLADREEAAEKSEDKAAPASTAESADTKPVSKPEVSSISGKKAAAKPEPKAKPKAPPAKVAAKSAKASKPSKPVKKSAPAKKKAKRR
jgi:putative FmdB family regulatory protein